MARIGYAGHQQLSAGAPIAGMCLAGQFCRSASQRHFRCIVNLIEPRLIQDGSKAIVWRVDDHVSEVERK